MERTSITFDDEIWYQLQQRAVKNGGQSIAQCVRELVDLGLKVEAHAEESGAKEPMTAMLDDLKKLAELGLQYSLEARLIGRFLVANVPDCDEEKRAEVLEKYPDRVIQHVKKLLHGQNQ